MRNGKWVKAPSKALVLGDVIKFSSGDRIGADVRLVEASSLYIEESALTGESVPVQKKVEALQGQDVSIGDQKIWLYGYDDYTRIWHRVVVATGMNTAMGQIANMLQCRADGNTTAKKIRTTRKILIIVVLF